MIGNKKTNRHNKGVPFETPVAQRFLFCAGVNIFSQFPWIFSRLSPPENFSQKETPQNSRFQLSKLETLQSFEGGYPQDSPRNLGTMRHIINHHGSWMIHPAPEPTPQPGTAMRTASKTPGEISFCQIHVDVSKNSGYIPPKSSMD